MEPSRLMFGRYRLQARVAVTRPGTEVWRGTDELTGNPVAIKLLRPATTEEALRGRREIATLRLVDIPGVVRLVDDGVDGPDLVIVMAWVEGTPFPGPDGARWEDLLPRLVELLRGLGALHAAGVVHRDLKPSNVLVNGEVVTIIDLGIARGAADSLTHTGTVLGTVDYLAPEQATGARVDARADLYALGVMLYEALCGALPMGGMSIAEILLAKQTLDAPPLPPGSGAPPGVAGLLARLLARDPNQRPGSTQEVLRALGQSGPSRLPWLGSAAAPDQLAERLLAGLPAWLDAPRGGGRSRVLEEVGARLEARGLTVLRAGPGVRPLESLAAWVPRAGSLAEAVRRVKERLAEGSILLVDDGLDAVSAQVLARVDAGAVLRLGAHPGAIPQPSLREADLLPLFADPGVVFHVAEDAARLLWSRTAGAPDALARELDTWVGVGVGRWVDDRIEVDRLALERVALGLASAPAPPVRVELNAPEREVLAWLSLLGPVGTDDLCGLCGQDAWVLGILLDELVEKGLLGRLPDGSHRAAVTLDVRSIWDEARIREAHLTRACQLPPGTPERLRHLLFGDDAVGFAEEALVRARQQILAGRATNAILPLTLALSRLPWEETGLERRLADELARAALSDGLQDSLATAAIELERIGAYDLLGIVRGWAAAEAGRFGEALEEVREMLPHPDEELDSYRLAMHLRLALRNGASVDTVIPVTGAEDPQTFIGRRRREWRAQAVRGVRPREAAALFASVAEHEPVGLRRVAAAINTGISLLADDDPEAAEPWLGDAVDAATRLRAPRLELWARCLLRSTQYRLDRPLRPAPELLDAATRLERPRIEAELALTDAALHWRAGELPEARAAARRSASAWRAAMTPEGAPLAEALGIAAGDVEVDVRRVALSASSVPPLARLQVAALLASVGVGIDSIDSAWLREALDAAPPGRQSVLALEECASYLGAAPRSG